jgi:CRP-like cAMP-binding protein
LIRVKAETQTHANTLLYRRPGFLSCPARDVAWANGKGYSMEHSPSNIATIGITARVVRRLKHFAPLTEVEQYTLERTCTVKRFGSHDELAKLGAPLPGVFAITDGFAARSRILPDGRRQILAYLIPGDLCDPRGRLLSRMDHSITALGPVEAAVFSDEAIQRLERYPGLARGFALNALVEQSVTREWLVNIGHRSSLVRLGHLFCEIHARLEAVGLTDERGCVVPLTQTELADTLAISAVHVNRTLMELRRAGLVSFHAKRLVIHDLPALRKAAGFNATYLQLGRVPLRLDVAREAVAD